MQLKYMPETLATTQWLCDSRLYNFGGGSWLAQANDTSLHYLVIQYPR